jgi:hypothetical protein
MLSVGGYRRQANQFSTHTPALHDGECTFNKAHLANKIGGLVQAPIGIDIANRVGLNRHTGFDRSFK